MKRRFSIRFMALIMVLSITAAGCLGRFAAFNTLSEWNQKVFEERWVNEMLFIVLVIVPVYQVALLGDVLIFNSVEFWTGENPIDESGMHPDREYRRTAESGKTKIVQHFRDSALGRSMVMNRYEEDRLLETVVLFREAGQPEFHGYSVSRGNELKIFKIGAGDGGPVLTEHGSGTSPSVRTFQGTELTRMTDRVAEIISPPAASLALAR